MTSDYVRLSYKTNKGWPWPEDSYGLSPMFGEDGWCRSCGVPNRPQRGNLILRRKGVTGGGVWVPFWRYNAVCLEKGVADFLRAEFELELRPVEWRATSPGDAFQIVIPMSVERWFSDEELARATTEWHGRAGAQCTECGVWRWLPLVDFLLPPVRAKFDSSTPAAVVSPEWFGDGWSAFNDMLFRRDLAELLVAGSIKELKISESAVSELTE